MSKYKWSILIPSLPARRELRKRVLDRLEYQLGTCDYDDIELLVLEDNRSREYGPKLQAMIDIAQGEYVCFVDDDDLVSDHYVKTLRPLMDGVDHVGFTASISIEGGPWKPVYYSVKHKVWRDTPKGYYRNPQHLTPIRRDLAVQIPWRGHYGADRDWSTRMAEAGLIQTENLAPKDDPVYFYYCDTTKNREGVWR